MADTGFLKPMRQQGFQATEKSGWKTGDEAQVKRLIRSKKRGQSTTCIGTVVFVARRCVVVDFGKYRESFAPSVLQSLDGSPLDGAGHDV